MPWDAINLRYLGSRETIRPTLGGVGLVYPGRRHVFSGPEESAKTIAAYAIALEEIRQGGSVILVDFEMGQWDALARLREMGATDDDLDRLPYVEPLDVPASDDAISALLDMAATLVVIDSAAGAYALEGLDDNLRRDVETFVGLYVHRFWVSGVATIVIDHVVKNSGTRGRYAIGSERKTGGADVHLGFKTLSPLSRGRTGRFEITTHKDRHGHLKRGHVADLEVRSDPSSHSLTWAFELVAQRPRPEHLMERISRHLEGLAPGASLPSGSIDTSVRGNIPAKRAALKLLVDEGYVHQKAGDHGAKLVSSVRPYRDASRSSSTEDERGIPTTSSSDERREIAKPVTSSSLVHVSSSTPRPSVHPPAGGR